MCANKTRCVYKEMINRVTSQTPWQDGAAREVGQSANSSNWLWNRAFLKALDLLPPKPEGEVPPLTDRISASLVLAPKVDPREDAVPPQMDRISASLTQILLMIGYLALLLAAGVHPPSLQEQGSLMHIMQQVSWPKEVFSSFCFECCCCMFIFPHMLVQSDHILILLLVLVLTWSNYHFTDASGRSEIPTPRDRAAHTGKTDVLLC